MHPQPGRGSYCRLVNSYRFCRFVPHQHQHQHQHHLHHHHQGRDLGRHCRRGLGRDLRSCRASRPAAPWLGALVLAAALVLQGAAMAAPFVPSADSQVLERLPARASDPRSRTLAALRLALAQAPGDAAAAVALAQAYFNAMAAEGDPRYVGHAQAALAPWWNLPDPPSSVRVIRAMLLQFDHQFEPALADLDAALRADPEQPQAWAWRAAIHLVRADYGLARASCQGLSSRVPPLVGIACLAQVDAVTGRTAQAAAALRQALADNPGASADQRLWVLTRLAETEERRGAWALAEAAFRQALALNIADVYLLGAYADFLLDQQRPAEVLGLLTDRGRADVLLLRQALAARALGNAAPAGAAQTWARELAARFDAARLRGDTTHQKEESRFLLALGPPGVANVQQSLKLASANFSEQREPADARILLQAALAARDRVAAEPAFAWLTASAIDSVVLRALAEQVRALP